ncbi:hypothetical protein NL108_011481 [Boleophthalmus pectinirostris]|uniref:uncharacterized protein LOC110158109 n=1 Tax=Boleophthalmus pectinirostris TaxID=150288 RepID=UPI00242AF7FE|nr:uncharacterized protein LOC110158109 [Boleophthalmus pectinirostris]KAJ0064650.1 hypothetical protein NL108_011481 [Boleophthalmus pectinirostris]
MDGVHEALGHVFGKLLEQALAFSLITLVLIYHLVFEVELPCTCENPLKDCIFYMTVPFLIILFAQLCVDQRFQRAIFGVFYRVALLRLSKALFIALVWVELVLVNGDWMLCCFNDLKHNVSCDKDFRLTQQHQRDVTEWKNFSRICGLSLLLFMLFLALVVKCLVSPKMMWADIILEKEEKILMEEQGEWVKDELKKCLKDRIKGRKWDKCLCVGDELMKHLQGSKEDQSAEDTTTSPEEVQRLLPHSDRMNVGSYGATD